MTSEHVPRAQDISDVVDIVDERVRLSGGLEVECSRCSHAWRALFFPMASEQLAAALDAVRCPRCGAPSECVVSRPDQDCAATNAHEKEVNTMAENEQQDQEQTKTAPQGDGDSRPVDQVEEEKPADDVKVD